MKNFFAAILSMFVVTSAMAQPIHLEYHGTDPDQMAEADVDFENHQFSLTAGVKDRCSGGFDSNSAGVNWKDNSFFVVSNDGECVVTFHRQGKGIYSATESSGCSSYHGASCGFELPGVWY